jgi:multiple sugar transport system substrate-binding protein
VIELHGSTWDHPRGWGGVRAAAEAFARERPDVRVTWEARTLQAFADHPIDQLAEAYDLIVLDHPSIGEAVAADALLPLDEHLDARFLEEQAATSVGRSYESYHWQGHQWALAIDAAAQVAAFRPDLLQAPVPNTWNDVDVLLDEVGIAVAMPAIPVDAICAFLGTCRSLGEGPFAADDAVVGKRIGREALELLRGVVTRAHPMSLASNPPTVLDRMANTDEIAYVPLAFGYVNFAEPGFAENVVRFAPGPAGATGVPSGTLGGAGLAVSSRTAHAETASAYAAFTASDEIQAGPYLEGGGQPGNASAWTGEARSEPIRRYHEDTVGALDRAYLRPRYDGFLGFQDQAGDLVHGYLRDGGDPDVVLDRLDAAYRASLGVGADR